MTTQHSVRLDAPLSAAADACAHAVAASLAHSGVTRLGVAYSGGVDSAVLAALAARALGAQNTVLLLAVSPSLPQRQHAFAQEQAEAMGLELVEISTHELADPRYAANGVDRCYFCKAEMVNRFYEEAATTLHLDALAIGTNADDLHAIDRPGQRAATERGLITPLADAGMTKADVRKVAAELGLPSAQTPASPCLASRIPHGTPVTVEVLERIDAAEDAVLRAGFSNCRVRDHGDIARIEVPLEEISLFQDPTTVAAVNKAVCASGYAYATIDLAGIRSGVFTVSLLEKSGGGND